MDEDKRDLPEEDSGEVFYLLKYLLSMAGFGAIVAFSAHLIGPANNTAASGTMSYGPLLTGMLHLAGVSMMLVGAVLFGEFAIIFLIIFGLGAVGERLLRSLEKKKKEARDTKAPHEL